ncbi:BH3-only protein sayonara isoform X2 [Haemaphysalis longicornis]
MGCGGSSHAPLPLDVVVTYPHKDTVAAMVKPQQNSCVLHPQETTMTTTTTEPQVTPPAKRGEAQPPAAASPPAQEAADPVAVEELRTYLQHERRIQQLERRRTLQSYQIKLDQLRQLEVAAANLENDRQRVEQKMAAVNCLLDGREAVTVRNELQRQKEDVGELHPDLEEYLDDLNRMEVCKNELKATERQIEVIQKEVQQLSNDCEELAQLYEDRDNLLDAIISKTAGSELECQLALDLEKLHICKQQVDHTHFKWSQALLMVRQACSQFSRALKKWKDLEAVPQSDSKLQYYCVAETRNNLSAALQNLQGAQRYLQNIDFPYCTPSETATVSKAVTYIFTDMKSPERREHAANCYNSAYRRAGALKQWLEMVINNIIYHDLDILEERCREKSVLLRKERIRLIKESIKNATGKEVQLDSTDNSMDENTDTFRDDGTAQLFYAERALSRSSLMTPESGGRTRLPTPVPTSDLAPLPPTEKIFGKVAELRYQHHEQMKVLKKVYELRQARLSKALQRKLEARRQRKNTTAHAREE